MKPAINSSGKDLTAPLDHWFGRCRYVLNIETDDPIFTKAMVQVQTIFEYYAESKVGSAIKEIWQNLSNQLVL